jgi:hypothetical protein
VIKMQHRKQNASYKKCETSKILETEDLIPIQPLSPIQSRSSLLHAWSRSPLPGAADRAEKILQYMIKSGSADITPDAKSFSSGEGLVGPLVFNEVRRAVPPKVLYGSMNLSSKKVGSLQVHQLPREWTKNNHFDKMSAMDDADTQRHKRKRPPHDSKKEKKNDQPNVVFVESSHASNMDMMI